jgi:UDP-N-acetylmuramate--alanine ligase
MREFAVAFEEADSVQVLDIYAASEAPIHGVTGEALARAISGPRVEYAASLQESIERVVSQVDEGDLILTLGAGSISQAGAMLLKALK